ncbi:MAG: efflux RND transporter periplasmic adaptor subunit [Chromatiaceae bacterium]|nr:MAG: efflux RND transporter periplasmic adaptor subunit [Chromatiaceae bacterium]
MLLRSLLVFLALGLLAGGLAYLKYQQIQAAMAGFDAPMPPETVTAVRVRTASWTPRIGAVGSVRAAQGVMVTNQVAGQVQRIRFESGDRVRSGQPLVQLDTEVDAADLAGLQASLNLARTQLERNQRLLRDRAVSQGDYDEISARLEQAQAGVAAKQALIEKKTIRAPFEGQLGIRQIDLGQYLVEGTGIVQLEALKQVYVDFTVPERRLAEIRVGQPVEVRVAAWPEAVFTGRIQALGPGIHDDTRSVPVRALLANPEGRLRPGMFAKVAALLPARTAVLTLPREAITFNTYGDSVFVIGPGEPAGTLVVQRRQVETGAVHGQEIEIVAGLAAGEQVVAAGQHKLRNGAVVTIVDDPDAGRPTAARDRHPDMAASGGN